MQPIALNIWLTFSQHPSKYIQHGVGMGSGGGSGSIPGNSLRPSWLKDASRIDFEIILEGFGLHFGGQDQLKIDQHVDLFLASICECIFIGC